jgi:hypothetical protein
MFILFKFMNIATLEDVRIIFKIKLLLLNYIFHFFLKNFQINSHLIKNFI